MVLGNLVYTRGRRVVGFFVKARSMPGVLAEVARVARDLGARILYAYFSLVPGREDIVTGFGVVDFTGLSLDPGIVAKMIEKVKGVLEVRVVLPQRRGILLDPYHFPIVGLGGERYMIGGETLMEGLVRGVEELVGSSASAGIRYHIGVAIGKSIYGQIQQLGANSPREALELFLLLAHQWGRHRGKIVEYSYRGEPGDTITIRLESLWECERAKKLGTPGPAAHLERGVVAGLLREATGRTVNVEETRCIAKNDPHCELKITFQD